MKYFTSEYSVRRLFDILVMIRNQYKKGNYNLDLVIKQRNAVI